MACFALAEADALASIAKALDVPADQVESWVVRAIGMKLIEGKIDQVRGVLSVTRATQPAFGAAQWKELATRLAALKSHLGSALSLVANVKPPQVMGTRTAGTAGAPAPVRA